MAAEIVLGMCLLGALLGACAGFLFWLLHDADWEMAAVGGAMGGLLASLCIDPTALTRTDLMLMFLAGYALTTLSTRCANG